VVEDRLDGDVCLAGDVGDRDRVEATRGEHAVRRGADLLARLRFLPRPAVG
jgi:hypothetical protein